MLAEADTDLRYDGRARKRPAGASTLVQQIYVLLIQHPTGLTINDLHDRLRDGWMDTDAYRSYEKSVIKHRDTSPYIRRTKLGVVQVKRSPKKVGDYGSAKFKEHAQHWWINVRLIRMGRMNTARREGARWFPGRRAPRVMVRCEKYGHHLVPMNVPEWLKKQRAERAINIHRNEVRDILWAGLDDKRIKGKSRALIQRAYDFICGRG